MRIAYLLGEDLSKHPGLKHKIDTHIEYWQAAGHEVFRIHHYDGIVVRPDGTEQRASPDVLSAVKKSKWQRMGRLSAQYEFVVRTLKGIAPDLTYSRYLFPVKGASKIKSYAGRLVIEINSDDRAEYLQKNWMTGIFNAVFRTRVLRKADGLVFVTNELAHKPVFSLFTSQRCIIGNGVEIASFEFEQKTDSSRPQLVFIGSPGQSWHGLDKIGYLAEHLPEFDFNIIGPDRVSCLKVWAEVPNNVIVYGYLTNDEAQKVIKKMDVGLSTLALHRKDMQEACPLKVRQYLAQGLPVIAASDDPDIQFRHSFYLRLSNHEKNVETGLAEIREFVERVTGDTDIRYSARHYAEQFLSASKKEAKRLQFFEEVVSS